MGGNLLSLLACSRQVVLLLPQKAFHGPTPACPASVCPSQGLPHCRRLPARVPDHDRHPRAPPLWPAHAPHPVRCPRRQTRRQTRLRDLATPCWALEGCHQGPRTQSKPCCALSDPLAASGRPPSRPRRSRPPQGPHLTSQRPPLLRPRRARSPPHRRQRSRSWRPSPPSAPRPNPRYRSPRRARSAPTRPPRRCPPRPRRTRAPAGPPPRRRRQPPAGQTRRHWPCPQAPARAARSRGPARAASTFKRVRTGW